MGELETAVTKSWASIFIDTTNKEQLVYEDFIAIYHVMNSLAIPGMFLMIFQLTVLPFVK